MKGFKTIGYNVIMAIILIAEHQGVGFGLEPVTIGYITMIGNFVLRFFTTTSVGQKS